jgi:hypothetical protein
VLSLLLASFKNKLCCPVTVFKALCAQCPFLSLPLIYQVMPDGSVMTPDGTRYTQSRRDALVKHLNNRLAEDEVVHDVVCIVQPGAASVHGMTVTVCNASDDKRDPLWQSDIQVI